MIENWHEMPAILKISAFFLLWVGVWLPVALFLKWHPLKPITAAQKLPLLASLYLVAPLVLWGVEIFEGTSFATYGLPWYPSVLLSLGFGFVLGAVGLLALFALQGAVGWLHWQFPKVKTGQPALPIALLSTLLLGLWVSLTEELVFRGFLLTQLQQNYRPWIAAAIASLIFALLHLVWERRENLPQLPGLWAMGMVLVLARWVDGGNLGLAWGLHSGWVWVIASLDTTPMILYTGKGPEWLTGLNGKPLAGLLGILFLLTTGVVLWFLL